METFDPRRARARAPAGDKLAAALYAARSERFSSGLARVLCDPLDRVVVAEDRMRVRDRVCIARAQLVIARAQLVIARVIGQSLLET
jgi:hypothetical protein